MKRHSTDLVSLVFGVIFLGAAGWWLVGQYVTIDVPHLGWITAAVLIGLGILGLAGSLRGDRPAVTAAAPTSGATAPTASTADRRPRRPIRPRCRPCHRSRPTFGGDSRPDEEPRDAPSTDPDFR